MHNKLLNTKVHLQKGKNVKLGRVMRRTIRLNEQVIGSYNNNSILNSIIYTVEFSDGEVREYSANLIAENMITYANLEEYSIVAFQSIKDQSRDEIAIDKVNRFIVIASGY